MNELEKIIRPIVEGQIRGFLKEHPVIVDAVDWYKPGKDKALTFTNSLSKRIVLDLTCGRTTARLVEALLASASDALLSLPCGTPTAGESGHDGTLICRGRVPAARDKEPNMS